MLSETLGIKFVIASGIPPLFVLLESNGYLHLPHFLMAAEDLNRLNSQYQFGQRFKQRFAGMSMAELLKAVWDFDICLCPACGHPAMKQLGRCYGHPS